MASALSVLSSVCSAGSALFSIKPIAAATSSLASLVTTKEPKWEPEPVTLIALTALLAYLPLKTKIRWEEHSISFDLRSGYQGLQRWLNNDDREKLIRFEEGVNIAFSLFPPPKIPYDQIVSEAGNVPVTDYTLDPLTLIWLTFVDGLIAQQITYGYYPDTNLSLSKKRTEQDFDFAEATWKAQNKTVDEIDKKISKILHEVIIRVQKALVFGQEPKQEDELSPLANRIKGIYSDQTFFLAISQRILELKKTASIEKDNFEFEPAHNTIMGLCAEKVVNFLKIRKEINRL